MSAIALSIVTAVVAPALAVDASTPEEGLRGIFSQKNVLGRVMAQEREYGDEACGAERDAGCGSFRGHGKPPEMGATEAPESVRLHYAWVSSCAAGPVALVRVNGYEPTRTTPRLDELLPVSFTERQSHAAAPNAIAERLDAMTEFIAVDSCPQG